MISFCVTNHNRTDLLYRAIKDALEHEFVAQIVISDDNSNAETVEYLFNLKEKHGKIKLFRNHINLDCYFNKRQAVQLSDNDWVVIADSDNQFGKDYFDRLENLWLAGLNPKTVYQPSFAQPHFNFTKYEGFLINSGNIGKYMLDATFSTMLNAMNYFVNRDEYLRVWDGSIDPVTSDSIYQNLNWFKGGNNMYVVRSLVYQHTVHDGSHYQNNHRRTPRGFHQQVENELKALK